jgi:hypothetical protein
MPGVEVGVALNLLVVGFEQARLETPFTQSLFKPLLDAEFVPEDSLVDEGTVKSNQVPKKLDRFLLVGVDKRIQGTHLVIIHPRVLVPNIPLVEAPSRPSKRAGV